MRGSDKTRALAPLALMACVVGLGAFSAHVLADGFSDPDGVPRLIPFRAHLESGGVPVTGPVSLTVSLFDAPTGGNRIWGPETHSVTPAAGELSILLGSSAPLPASVLEGGDAWVGIEVGSTSLAGRQRLGSAPYALRASYAEEYGQPGDIIASMLPEVEFARVHGPGWVLMDGRAIDGTALAAILCPSAATCSVPDVRGAFLRAKNNGRADGNENPDGELALGQLQTDAFASHDHGGGNHRHSTAPGGQRKGVVGYHIVVEDTYNNYLGYVAYSGNIIAPNGGNETRPTNVTVNYFIRVD